MANVGLARAIDAEKPDPIVDIEPQVEIAQHRSAIVAHRRSFKLDQRRRQRPRRRGQRERRHALLDHLGDRLQLGQPFDARLRLRRLARFRPEAIDEALQMRALGVLLGPGRGLQPRLLRATGFEIVVAAGVELELAVAQMQDGVDRIVEKLAVVADDQAVCGYFCKPRFQPKRAFKVEIVGRLVEQQQVGFREQRRRQRHAHAPAAGKFRHRAVEIGIGKAKPAEDFRRARRRAIGIDRVQPLIDVRKLFGLGCLQCGIQRFAPGIGGQNRVEQAYRRGRMLLIDRSDPGGLRQQDLAALRNKIAEDRA